MGFPMPDFPSKTMIGAMSHYISSPSITKLQPMNANFALVDDMHQAFKEKKDKANAIAQRSMQTIDEVLNHIAAGLSGEDDPIK
jgi:methylenetetrahydrofolate--tRNA-(uracil-5-)-methyltransferase